MSVGVFSIFCILGASNQTSSFSDVAVLQQQEQLQQQLRVLATSPFGDSPLFRTSLKAGHNH